MPTAKKNSPRSTRRHRRGGGNPVAIAKVKADADRYALAVLPIIIEIHANGETSLGEIAAELNNRAIPTARGRQWQPMTVSNLLARVRRLLLDATFLEHDRADTAVGSRSQDFL